MPRNKQMIFCKGTLQFYRTHLKGIPWVRASSLYLYYFLLPIFSKAYFWYKYYQNVEVYTLIKLSIYLRSTHANKQVLLAPEEIVYTPVRVFPPELNDKLNSPSNLKTFPEVALGTISNGVVIGNSNIVFSGHYAITHDLINLAQDYTSEELHHRYFIANKLRSLIRVSKRKHRKSFPTAASFTDACSSNYAHWLTEILPRIHLFLESGTASNIPLIIDRGLHPNLMESLSVISDRSISVFKLGRDQVVQVENLKLVSVAGYVPFARRKAKFRGSQGDFSPSALKGMVSKVRQNLNVAPIKGWRKLYVRRNSSTRTLSNREEIENILMQDGFEVVEPEILSFAEQVKLFSEGSVIIGATGAAMANLMFCSSLTKVIVLMGIHDEMPYSYWRNIGSAVGVEVHYVLGQITSSRQYGIHSNFRIEPKDLLQALEIN